MRFTVFSLLIVIMGGCSSGSFVGKRFDNFTAYYNTFYNAQKSFDAATKATKTDDVRVDRSTYLRVIDLRNGAAGGRDFENAIKKSADVLREHPQSKWVDDALLLIGKSYYYTNNTVGAEQKFIEVIQRESSLEDEARFWLGLTLISSGALNQAGDQLRESIERDGVDRKWRAKMRAVLGDLYVRQGRWDEAAQTLYEATASIKDNRLGGRAQFLLGQVYETLGDYESAARAYRDVRRFKPLYELSFASQFNAIRVEGIHGNRAEALKSLRKMSRDDKHYQYRGELAYLGALILQHTGDPEAAVAEYKDLLYDADGNISNVRGQMHYQLGVIYRDMLPDFPRAAAHFDTARTALKAARPATTTAAATVPQPAPGAVTDAAEQAEVFGSYAAFHKEVARFDSLLYLGSLDEADFAAKIQEIRRQRADELIAERERQKSRNRQQQFGRSSGFEASGGTANVAANTATGSAGFLFHRDRSRVQENLLSFFDRWGDRPLVANWRRSAAVTGQVDRSTVSAGTSTQTAVAGPVDLSAGADALLASVQVDITPIPRTAERRDAMRAERARARYELANVLFLSVQLPDSAAAWYRRVVEEDQDLPVASRALYAIAEVQRSLGDTTSANGIYRRVVDEYPDSEVAGRAAERIGIVLKRSESEAAPASGDGAYEAAYSEWKSGQLELAARQMITVASNFRDQDVAPRALLATGAIFIEWSESTARDVLDPIEMDIPDSLWKEIGLWVPTPDPESAGSDKPADAADGAAATPSGVNSDAVVTATADSTADVAPVSVDEPLDVAIRDSALATGQNDRETTRAEKNPLVDATGAPDTPKADSLQVPDKASAAAGAEGEALSAQSQDDTPQSNVQESPPDSAENRASIGSSFPSVARSPIYLDDVYKLVVESYAGTDFARVAKGLLAGLTELRQEREDAARAAAAAEMAATDTMAVDLAALDRARPDSAAHSGAEAAAPDVATEEQGGADSPRPGEFRTRSDEQLAAGQKGPSKERLVDPGLAEASPVDTVTYHQEELVDRLPVPVGGRGSIQRMFRYPIEAKEKDIQGPITVGYVVDQRGQIADLMVENGPGAGCNEEAMRVMRLVRYRPAMKDGVPVRFRMTERLNCGEEARP